MAFVIFNLPHIFAALLLGTSIVLVCRLFFNRARRVALWRPCHALARPSISLLDGCVVAAVALFVLAGGLLNMRAEPGEPLPLTTAGFLFHLLLSMLWIAPAAAVLFRPGSSLAGTFGIRRETARRDCLAGLRFGVMMLFPVFAASIATGLFFRAFGWPIQTQSVLLQLTHPDTPALLRVLFSISLFTLVPVVEESAFRGVLIPAFARVEPWPALLVCQAVFFSLIHCNAYAAPGLFVVGACLGLGYARTGSLLTPIAMHAVFNLFAVLMAPV